MDRHQHHLHQLQYLNKHHPPQSQTPEIASAVGAVDRFPQWSMEETRELIVIRGELDQTFMETKRNKLLWEVISNKMRDKSFPRSSEQCKCKWKNLVTRFKGCETMEAETARQQFPFYDDMQTIFASRMQRMQWTDQGGGSGTIRPTRKRSNSEQFSSDEEEENVNEELLDISKDSKKNIVKKRKGGSISSNNGVKEVLDEFMKQQMRMEKEWRERWEAREKERAEKEEEWRRKMEELEMERMEMERMWRDREEQRRLREEIRSEKRDSLINALLAKLTRDGSL